MAGAAYGLPDVYHADEPRIVERAVRFHTGDLDPRFFNWPSLYMYLLSGLYGLVFGGFGREGVVAAFARDPVPFYLLGRVVTAAFGTATIAVLYILAAEFYGRTIGLLAALFLTLNLLHIRDSHYITTDVPLTCLITLATLFVLRYLRDGRARDALLGGLATGLAASMKYPGGLMLLPLLLAQLGRPLAAGESRWRRLVGREMSLGLGAALLAFLVGTPYALLTPRAFVSGVVNELGEVGTVQFGNEGDLPGYLFHLVHSLPEGMGLPVLSVATVGLAVLLRRHTRVDLLLLAFAVPYFAVIGSWNSRFERYALPLLPTLTLLAGVGVVAVADALAGFVRTRRGIGAGWRPGFGVVLVGGLLIAPEAGRVAHFHVVLARPDTRQLAAEWIVREIPPGARVALEPYTPSLPVVPAPRGYRISRLAPYEIDRLLERQVEYVVLSGFVYQRHQRACERFADECRFYRDIERRATLLLALDPGPTGQPLWVGDIYSPLTHLYGRTRPGPSLRIYHLTAGRSP